MKQVLTFHFTPKKRRKAPAFGDKSIDDQKTRCQEVIDWLSCTW
jgi:hypothetical protein